MKVAALSILALAGLVAAQDSCLNVALTAVPQCAQTCLQSAGQAVGCGELDFSCQCKPDNSAKISTEAAKCVIKGCGAQTAAMVAAGASAVCKCAGSGGSGSASTPASAGATATGASNGTSGGGSGSSPTAAASTPSKQSIQTGGGATATMGLGGLAAGILGIAAFL